eukprot:CAMPEP_0118828160 /NCGR_PEP_ID=MMETSP1162-20130426/17036_1 /TAXON_ID=33656 /ORGANISM="Phaeocystis Sp, Strain CCMP2710" /LENGTH=40 /DNA_ID= /DNA_START= /DNA_END= /DNA_ORIENTATION=
MAHPKPSSSPSSSTNLYPNPNPNPDQVCGPEGDTGDLIVI